MKDQKNKNQQQDNSNANQKEGKGNQQQGNEKKNFQPDLNQNSGKNQSQKERFQGGSHQDTSR